MNTYLNQIVSDDNFKPVKAKFQEGLLFGTVTLPDGVVLTLEENAICDDTEDFYKATATDACDNIYSIRWEVRDDFSRLNEDEGDACDWEDCMVLSKERHVKVPWHRDQSSHGHVEDDDAAPDFDDFDRPMLEPKPGW